MIMEQNYEVHPEIAKELAPQPVAQETIEQEVQEAVEQQEQEVDAQQAQEQPSMDPIEDKQERNFRRVIDEKRKAERERDEYRRMIELMQNQQPQQQMPHQTTQYQPQSDINVDPESYAEGKHINAVYAEVKALRQQIVQQQQQTVATIAEQRLRADYPDIDSVVSSDNVRILKEQYPEIARTLSSSSDVYDQGASAYTMIKTLGIGQQQKYNPTKTQIAKNMAKPRPASSAYPQQVPYDASPVDKVSGFSDNPVDNREYMNNLYKDMIKSARGY